MESNLLDIWAAKLFLLLFWFPSPFSVILAILKSSDRDQQHAEKLEISVFAIVNRSSSNKSSLLVCLYIGFPVHASAWLQRRALTAPCFTSNVKVLLLHESRSMFHLSCQSSLVAHILHVLLVLQDGRTSVVFVVKSRTGTLNYFDNTNVVILLDYLCRFF